MTDDDSTVELSRRRLMQVGGSAAAAGLLGAGASTAAAHGGFHAEFANWRVREAAKVWDRGYRGRPDRSVGITDSGIDVRHPDLGPWNGVRAVEVEGEGEGEGGAEMELRTVETGSFDFRETELYEGIITPGAAGSTRATHDFEVEPDGEVVAAATLSWMPVGNINDLVLETQDGEEVARVLSPIGGTSVSIQETIDGSKGYRWVVETFANTASEYEIDATYTQGGITEEPLEGEFSLPTGEADASTPKTVGWNGTVTPQDGDGHGSHVASIMAGSGRASQPDPATVIEEEPRAVLTAGDAVSYEFDVDEEGRGVFVSAYGEAVELRIENPAGETVESSSVTSDASTWDSNLAVAPALESGTYTVRVRPAGGEAASTGRLQRVSAGVLAPADGAAGDRTAAGETTVQAGVAPNAGLVGLQGLGDAFETLATHPGWFAETFNLRAVNMSWGGLPNERTGTTGRYENVERIAEGGILTVSSAGNNGPFTGPTGPSGGSEAVATVSTGPLDGVVAYTSGGTVVRGNDGDLYRKPDVTAPGGSLSDLIQAADIGADPTDPDETVRGYTGKAGTSMAAPYACGTAGLLAEAMEEDAPAAVALPEPAETDREDVLRLKSVLLATASETAFTAAPYHRGHAPTYEFGGRDSVEGFGRVNPEAAVDAVTRELSGTTSETLGLDVPEDARAVAGYLEADDAGTVEAAVSFSHYGGGNAGMTKGDPHLDLFVYDAEEPAARGEPNVVARAQGPEGEAAVSASVEAGVYLVVAKLVDVPGVANGYDVQAHLELAAGFDPLGFRVADGDRESDSSVHTAGQPSRVEVTVDGPTADAEIRDVIPEEWTVDEAFSPQVDRVEAGDGVQFVYFTEDVAAGEAETVEYIADAPESLEDTNQYQFGPAEARPADGGDWVAVPGTSEGSFVVGVDT